MWGEEMRGALQTLNPVKSEVWNLRATVSLAKFHFFSPEFRRHVPACAWQGRVAHWCHPSLLGNNPPATRPESRRRQTWLPLVSKQCDLFSLHFALWQMQL